ncbi:MAG: hypothetical protein KAX05_16895, partial [Bacteroidales bacterium]|nr:hypothetical protein [Bacteroidales bacterium]
IKEKLFEQNPEWKDLFSLRFEDMQIFAWPPDVLNHSSVEAEKKVQMKRTTKIQQEVDAKEAIDEQTVAQEKLNREKEELTNELKNKNDG